MTRVQLNQQPPGSLNERKTIKRKYSNNDDSIVVYKSKIPVPISKKKKPNSQKQQLGKRAYEGESKDLKPLSPKKQKTFKDPKNPRWCPNTSSSIDTQDITLDEGYVSTIATKVTQIIDETKLEKETPSKIISEEIKKLSLQQTEEESNKTSSIHTSLKTTNNPEDAYWAIYKDEYYQYIKRRENMVAVDIEKISHFGITFAQRAILLSWLWDLCLNIGYNYETYLKTVVYIDLVISHVAIHISHLQLIGITALYIAGKFNEHKPICSSHRMSDFTMFSCSAKQIRSCERDFLTLFQGEFNIPTAADFLQLFIKSKEIPDELGYLSLYLMRGLSLLPDWIGKPASAVAAVALAFSNVITGNFLGVNDVEKITGYEIQDIIDESKARRIFEVFQELGEPVEKSYEAVHKRFPWIIEDRKLEYKCAEIMSWACRHYYNTSGSH